MPLLAAQACRQFEAAARRIEGCIGSRVPRLPSAFLRRAPPHELSCSAAADDAPLEHHESSWLSSDASACDLSVTEERLSDGQRRVQRLVELAQMDTLGGQIIGDNDERMMDIRTNSPDRSSNSPAPGQSLQDTAPRTSLGGGKQPQQAVNVSDFEVTVHGGCDLSHDSFSSSTNMSLSSAIWDHDQSLCLSDDSKAVCTEQSVPAGPHLAKEGAQEAASNAVRADNAGERCFNKEEHESNTTGPVAVQCTRPLASQQPVAAALLQTSPRLKSCESQPIPHKKVHECDEQRGATGTVSPDANNERALKEQRRLCLEQELVWARQALLSRKQHLKTSRLASTCTPCLS